MIICGAHFRRLARPSLVGALVRDLQEVPFTRGRRPGEANRMPTPKEIDIGFLGTGLMGAPMVGRLCAAGFPVKVWNRTLEKAEALAGIGATVARTLEDAVSGARVVITMLTDGPAVSEVLFGAGVSDTLSTGSTVIDMSSIAPALARDHAAQLAANGLDRKSVV